MCRLGHLFKKFRRGARKRLTRLHSKHPSKFRTQCFLVEAKSFQIMPQVLAKCPHKRAFAAGFFQIFTVKKRRKVRASSVSCTFRAVGAPGSGFPSMSA